LLYMVNYTGKELEFLVEYLQFHLQLFPNRLFLLQQHLTIFYLYLYILPRKKKQIK
jgi:hypothetical protein